MPLLWLSLQLVLLPSGGTNLYVKFLKSIFRAISTTVAINTLSSFSVTSVLGARTQPGDPQPGIPTTRKVTTRKDTTQKRHYLEETQPGRDVTWKGFNPEEDFTRKRPNLEDTQPGRDLTYKGNNPEGK